MWAVDYDIIVKVWGRHKQFCFDKILHRSDNTAGRKARKRTEKKSLAGTVIQAEGTPLTTKSSEQQISVEEWVKYGWIIGWVWKLWGNEAEGVDWDQIIK